MNFPEYDCENEEILELLSYLPITTTDDYPWMQKYIDDLQLHYKKAEYELAVISAHMIYMFIIYCFILKKREFDLNQIKSDFQCDQEHCPKVKTDINPYLYVHKGDKECFKYLKAERNKRNQHIGIVKTRDKVAHCSGNVLSEIDFIDYLHKCIENIAYVNDIILSDFKMSDKLKKKLENKIDWEDVISIFLVSPVEFRDLFEEKYGDDIEEKLSDISTWEEMLDNTEPANYGINNCEIYASDISLKYESIDADYVDGTFEAEVSMDITFQMGSSKDGIEEHYNEQHHVSGTFSFDSNSEEFSIQIDALPSIDFYAE